MLRPLTSGFQASAAGGIPAACLGFPFLYNVRTDHNHRCTMSEATPPSYVTILAASNFDPHGRDRNAGYFFKQSAEDYAAARCCLLNGLFPGFVMAEQAVEKLIKGFTLFMDPGFKPKKGKGHDLPSLITVMCSHYAHVSLAPYEKTIELLQSSYDGRYPDSETKSLAHMTAQLNDVDELYIYLLDQSPITGDLRYQIGAWPYLYTAYLEITNMPDPKWAMLNNLAARRLLMGRPIPANIQRWKDVHDRDVSTSL
jgi:HEPN domain-containing protein